MILITGASQGIGFECAQVLLARSNFEVLITGRDPEKLARARESTPAAHRDRLRTRVCDQADRRDVELLCDFLKNDSLKVDGAILNVGVNPVYSEGPRRVHALDASTIETTIRTNCTHTMLVSAVLLDRFRSRREGVLLWVGSQAQKHGVPGAGLYGATKSFLSGLARTAHNEYAPRGIRVHLVHPGLVRTPRTSDVVEKLAARHGIKIETATSVASRIWDVFVGQNQTGVEVDL